MVAARHPAERSVSAPLETGPLEGSPLTAAAQTAADPGPR